MQKEYDLKKLKIKRRGLLPGLSKQAARPEHMKVRVTILLDQDVLAFFKDQSAQMGALPYQTQINQALRQFKEQGAFDTREALKTALVHDPDFIQAVAKATKRKAA